ncbi:MAG: tRNA lysidine(34) synthetase TilS, partial [Flavobacteriaceae bacterium]|nr:tRNA lysidine(34) synthetase TilS [Flavobacteriaceae bacterium]
MFNLFSDHVNSDFDFLKKSKLLVCLSGGVDSMVLIDLLRRSNYDVSVAHCNFKLRGDESDLDEKFVKKYCYDNSIQFFSKSFHTKLPNHSLQMAARTLRYDWFNELLNNNNKDYILTAHHLDDSLETFIINLSRASGIEGFTGISPVNDKIVRMLSIFSKKQILKYAKINKIHWREDSTNKKDDYQRNYIRNQIIPLLKKLYPNFLSQSKKTMNFLKNSQLVIDKYIEAVKKEKFVIKNDEIIIEKKFVRCNKNDIYNLFKDYGFKNPSEILMLCNSISGKIIESVSHVLLSDRTNLILKKK